MKLTAALKKICSPVALLRERDLIRAIGKKEFVFFYQPQVDLNTGRVIGIEALIRWRHPKKGMINPAAFIPTLESTGLINKLTPFLFAQSAKDLKFLHEQGFRDLVMSVNISVVQLENKQLTSALQTNLKKHGIDPMFYECEITETSVMKNVSSELEILRQIADMRVKLSVDDFGSGYASFNYLRRLKIQKLKIDMEFVSSLFEHKNNEIILEAMIDLGHKLHLQVLAEGVETKEQADWLKAHGCDLAQGFYFARPLDLPELITYLTNNKKKK